MVKLPDSYNFEDIQRFEFKATSKSGDELINQNVFNYVTVSDAVSEERTVHEKDEDREIATAVYRVPCIELSTLL